MHLESLSLVHVGLSLVHSYKRVRLDRFGPSSLSGGASADTQGPIIMSDGKVENVRWEIIDQLFDRRVFFLLFSPPCGSLATYFVMREKIKVSRGASTTNWD